MSSRNVRGWRMLKRRRQKFRRELQTALWIERVRLGRLYDRPAIARLERWLAACGFLVMVIAIIRGCS